jgi:CDP-6-deoxy-D-xylo-4-hexulose-3-dehydrase
MDRVFWIGVYPGLTVEMLDFIVKVAGEFVGSAKVGLVVA